MVSKPTVTITVETAQLLLRVCDVLPPDRTPGSEAKLALASAQRELELQLRQFVQEPPKNESSKEKEEVVRP